MKTKKDCMDLFLRLLDEATKKGLDLPASKNADYRDKFNYFLDYANKYIAGIIKIPAVYNVVQNPVPNLLGYMQGFDLKQYRPDLPDSEKTITLTGVKSYYFEIENNGTVIFYKNGTLIKSITNTIKGVFTAYKGNLSNTSSTDTITIEFAGDYICNYRNIAFYGYNFPSGDDVPVYAPYLSYDMPADFMEFDSVIMKSDPRVYQRYIDLKWENNKKVILNYYDSGSFDIHYYRYPATISPTADDSTVIDAEDKAIELIVLEAGIKATAADNPSLSSWLRQLFIEQMNNVSNDRRITETAVQTIYTL